MANKPFKMKGSPMKRNFGIGADSPMKETTMPSYGGVKIDPTLSYKYKSAKIPGFRDMVSLEQQQAARKAWKAKRAKRKEERQHRKDQDTYLASEEGQKNIRRTAAEKTLPEVKTLEEPGLEDPLEKYVVNKPLTLPEIEEKKKERKKKVKKSKGEISEYPNVKGKWGLPKSMNDRQKTYHNRMIKQGKTWNPNTESYS